MKGERGSGVRERQRAEGSIKKGPWTVEEDQVLVNFVNKYGPKDWSSLRSMGLLPRTGKSCRLRWVNKLRPNLKVGCKFTAEEERVVIDLQARFGNKWATIATYLPGRTDNDVKNFWSSRQKRLAKILQSPPSRNKSSHKNKGKTMPMAPQNEVLPPPQAIEHPPLPSASHSCSTSSTVCPQMLPLMPLPDLLSPHPNNTYSAHSTPTDQYNQPNSIAEATLLPLLPDHHDLVFDMFASRQVDELDLSFGSEFQLELLGGERKGDGGEQLETLPDSFFDELPADMFDCLEPNPSSSSNFSN